MALALYAEMKLLFLSFIFAKISLGSVLKVCLLFMGGCFIYFLTGFAELIPIVYKKSKSTKFKLIACSSCLIWSGFSKALSQSKFYKTWELVLLVILY